MSNVIEVALLALVAYLAGCLIGYGTRRLAFRPKAVALPVLTVAPPGPPPEPVPEEGPIVVDTKMPAKPRRANVRIVIPMPKPDEIPPEPSPERFAFALDAPKGGKADNLKQINGIGPKLESKLNEAGVFHFSQIAAWSVKSANLVDERLGLGGRVAREGWVSQAKALKGGVRRNTKSES